MSFLAYLGKNNQYGCTMSQELPIYRLAWTDSTYFKEDFVRKYDESCSNGYILEADVKYPEQLGLSHSELYFLPMKTKIDKQQLICNVNDKKICSSYQKSQTSS